MPHRLCSPVAEDMSDRSQIGGIEVNIIDFESRRPLPQIHVSKTSLGSFVKLHRHVIFAVPGLKFGIQVTTRAGFDWGDANALEVEFGFDLGNVVNQKRVYLAKSASFHDIDNALLEMHKFGDKLTCCIDQILIQHPGGCIGEAESYYFSFENIVEDINHHRPKSIKSEKVSQHQGKIRVEVSRKRITPGRERHPGLRDTLIKETRSNKEALKRQGILMEINIEKVPDAGVVQYGGAFRPTVCKRPADTTRYVFEFLYRASHQIQRIVDPRFRNDVSANWLQSPRADTRHLSTNDLDSSGCSSTTSRDSLSDILHDVADESSSSSVAVTETRKTNISIDTLQTGKEDGADITAIRDVLQSLPNFVNHLQNQVTDLCQVVTQLGKHIEGISNNIARFEEITRVKPSSTVKMDMPFE